MSDYEHTCEQCQNTQMVYRYDDFACTNCGRHYEYEEGHMPILTGADWDAIRSSVAHKCPKACARDGASTRKRIDEYLSLFAYCEPGLIPQVVKWLAELRAEVLRLKPYEQLADELAEFADHHPPCGRHCSSHDPAPCGCGLDALLDKHATLKGAK